MLRTRQDERMANLCAAADALVNKIAGEYHLSARWSLLGNFSNVNFHAENPTFRRLLEPDQCFDVNL
ncbi:hypothetical protein [Mesorhizobium sp.]|uniref:hypothetical protein n=1 Tax=Mesorhizobium sp. TaxID=1871066 RepID=UPI0025C167B9|nr:hypothetical protein [Mesorhizobium sp.]